MNKKEVSQRVLKDGKPLPIDKFIWDETTNTFSSREDNLVLDFNEVNNCTFKTGGSCTFKTGSDCTFNTGSFCTFDTWSNCTFKTGYDCTFDTGERCTFDTREECVVVRRDVYEVIELYESIVIKLNEYEVKGFTVIDSSKRCEKCNHLLEDGINE